MPSITPVMSAMRRELSEIALMVCTTPSTTSPPRNATAEASLDQAVGLAGVVGVLLHGAGQFFHRRGRLFQ